VRRAGSFSSLARASKRTYASSGTGRIERLTRVSRDPLLAPSQGEVYSDGTTLYVYGGPIYSFSGIDYTEKSAIPATTMSVNSPMVDVGRLGDGTVVVSADQAIWRDSDAGWSEIANPGSPSNITAFAASNNLVIATGYYEDSYEFMFETDRAMAEWTEIDPIESPLIDGLFIANDNTVYAVGRVNKDSPTDPDLAAFAIRTAGMWNVIVGTEQDCRADAVHGDSTGRVVAAGVCGGFGVIWRYDATTDVWPEIYRAPGAFSAVLALGNGEIIATGDAGTVRGDGTTWIVDNSVRGRSLSGGVDDVWLAGYFTNVQRFDGATWSQVTTQAITTMLVSVGDDDITFPGAASGRLRLVRDR
jgi:hypothetical protein